MKKIITAVFILAFTSLFSQEKKQDSTKVFKKRVLESVEVDLVMSYYKQDGSHAAVTGGIGTEKLKDLTSDLIVVIPLNDDDVLTIETGISAYTSASSSNLNPFSSGASSGDDDDDDSTNVTKGSPWVESSGASGSDAWLHFNGSYSHSSDDRNKIWGANISVASEYDYFSMGFGGSYAHLFNQKNTEIGIKGNVYLDTWNPVYPTEIKTYNDVDGDLNAGFFEGKEIFDSNGFFVNPNSPTAWKPLDKNLVVDKKRNTFSVSLSVSQILSKSIQASLFLDIVKQDGWLSNPMQRVYFADKANFYMGNPASISNYTSPTNADVFQLADDIERLPSSRFKIPIGMRLNFYLSEVFVLRTYYRYYSDDWGIKSNTISLEMPIKLGSKFTLYPNYRYYQQSASDYFAPYEENLSTQDYYTSDYDLSKFDSHQYGLGIKYTDIFTKAKILYFGLKSVELRYSNYKRNNDLDAGIVTFRIKFVN